MNSKVKLQNAFSRALNLPLENVTEDLKYQSIPEWDSVSHMVLIMEIEQEFEISLSTDDVINLESFDKAIEIINTHIQA